MNRTITWAATAALALSPLALTATSTAAPAAHAKAKATAYSVTAKASTDTAIAKETTVKVKGEKQRLVEGPTKSGRTRVVDIDEQTANRLRWFRVYRAGNLAIKLVNPDMVVFGDEEGSWRLPESFSRTFRQQLARFRRTHQVNQQIPAIHFHSLRHTHAVWLLKAGVHPKVVQERLGHETTGIAMDIYSHVMPSMGREASAQLGTMLYSN